MASFYRWVIRLTLFAMLLTVTAVSPAAAQDGAAGGEIVITGTDTNAIPSLTVTLYARDADGQAIPLSASDIAIRHQGELVPDENVNVVGPRDIGVFTLFLVDLPGGVEGQTDAMTNALKTYAAETNMKSQVDWAALYRVGATAAEQLLEPVNFGAELINYLNRSPLETRGGATALVDSIGTLIDQVETIAPGPDLQASIVVLSDGTDAVSQRYDATALAARARERGIFLHTIVVDNVNLTFGRDIGAQYMAELAAGSGGSATQLANSGGLDNLWRRIASYRSHTVVQYTVADLEPGTASVEVSLPDMPELGVQQTTITIPDNLPSIVIDVAPEDRVIVLPALDRPVRLSIPTTVTWLDGQTRTLTEAQLLVNGEPVMDVPVEDVARFTVDIPSLRYGDNSLRLAVRDDQGIVAQSPEFTLTVAEGSRAIPAALRAGGNVRVILLWVMVGFLLVLLLLSGRYLFRRIDWSGLRRSRGRADNVPPPAPADRFEPQPTVNYAPTPPPAAAPAVGSAEATLEILDAKTRLPRSVPISRTEFLIGRSPTVDLAFVEDPTVSRIHATIVYDQNQNVYRVYDERSTSGTFLNDRQVPEYGLQLSDGDELHLGAVHLRFRQARR